MKLSVIIAAGYPRPWRIRALLAALDMQTRKPDEIIVADDTGLDPSPFDGLGAVVRTMLFPGVNGVSRARNMAVAASTGDLLMFLDDDSIPHKMCCQVHCDIHAGNEKLGALLGQRTPDYIHLSRPIPCGPLTEKSRRETSGQLGWGNFISNNLTIRRNVFEALGGFDEGFAVAGEYGWEDVELGIRFFAAGHLFGYSPDALVFHPDGKRTPEKQAAADKAWLRLVSKHPEIAKMTP